MVVSGHRLHLLLLGEAGTVFLSLLHLLEIVGHYAHLQQLGEHSPGHTDLLLPLLKVKPATVLGEWGFFAGSESMGHSLGPQWHNGLSCWPGKCSHMGSGLPPSLLTFALRHVPTCGAAEVLRVLPPGESICACA